MQPFFDGLGEADLEGLCEGGSEGLGEGVTEIDGVADLLGLGVALGVGVMEGVLDVDGVAELVGLGVRLGLGVTEGVLVTEGVAELVGVVEGVGDWVVREGLADGLLLGEGLMQPASVMRGSERRLSVVWGEQVPSRSTTSLQRRRTSDGVASRDGDVVSTRAVVTADRWLIAYGTWSVNVNKLSV
jgi:hypothetical protein